MDKVDRTDILAEYLKAKPEEIFGSETADSEAPAVVQRYFVEDEKFSSFTNANRNFGIARARKGVGKSALLKHVAFSASKQDSLVSFRTGSELLSHGVPSGESNLEVLKGWTELLAAAACEVIAENIVVPKDPLDVILLRKLNPIEAKMGFWRTLISTVHLKLPFIGLNGYGKTSYVDLLTAFQKKSDVDIWLIVDDIDATFTSSDEEKLSLSQFFTAARLLSSNIRGLKVRASVRKDVWTTISRFDESLDKCEQDVIDIKWSYKGTQKIISNRIRDFLDSEIDVNDELAKIALNGATDQFLIGLVAKPRLAWGAGTTEAFRVFHRLSGGRPRWALQLCKSAALHARSVNSHLITTGAISHVVPSFSRFRIGDIVKEHRHQCAKIEEVIMAFDGHKPKFSTAEILSYIEGRICKFYDIDIEGDEGAESKDIASFLFRIDFIEAVDNSDYTRHYRYEDYPHFFRSLSADHSFVRWEINPSFRAGLHL